MRTHNSVIGIEDIRTDCQTASECGVQQLDVTLIRPTNYTDDGYPIKTRIGVIRSNTLTQIGTLVRDLVNDPFFQGIQFNIRKIDEAIEWIPVKEIVHQSKVPGVKSIVMLVGVQTNQFPRALDIASKFLPHGIPVLIGGFHVSGMLAMIGVTRDLKNAISQGVTLVAGEVEGGRLSAIVTDILKNRARSLYNFLNPHQACLMFLSLISRKKNSRISHHGSLLLIRGAAVSLTVIFVPLSMYKAGLCGIGNRSKL